MWGKIIAGVFIAGAGAFAGHLAREEEVSNAKHYGKTEAKAEYDIELQKMRKKYTKELEQIVSNFKDKALYTDLCIASYAVACCIASVDGKICSKEKQELDNIWEKLLFDNLPDELKNRAKTMKEYPPTPEQLFHILKKDSIKEVVGGDYKFFVTEAHLMAHIDGKFCENEEKFIKEMEQKFSVS